MPAPNDLAVTINRRLAGGERLLASGAMVGDAGELRLWRSSRDLWAGTVTKELAGAVDEAIIRTFSRAVTPPPGEGDLAEDLPIELEGVRGAMAVLIGIRSQLPLAEPAPRPPYERRGRRLGPQADPPRASRRPRDAPGTGSHRRRPMLAGGRPLLSARTPPTRSSRRPP